MGGEAAPAHMSTSYPKLSAGPVGKQIHSIYEDRLRQFTGNGQYSGDNLTAKIYEGRASGKPAVKLSVYSPPDLSRPTFEDATSHEFKATHVGESFGPSWSTHWFKIQLSVPKELRDKERLEFHWNANNEGLIWSEHGEPLQGLTGGGDREQWILPDSFCDGEEHIFYIEMACNGMFGNAGGDIIQPPNPKRYFKLLKAEIVAVNLEARALYMDFWIIGDAARELPQDSWQEHKALQVANRIMDHFIAGNGSKRSISECRKIAREYLGESIDSDKVYQDGRDVLVNAIGYCHIDTCWLWPWAETKRKVARSWANQCDLMERYPEHRFVCSQAQQYKWLKQYYPALWDRVKAKVKDGQFQPIGGSWVEHDTNLPGGESLVRQFLYGQRFFESHFGQRSKTFLLPDTFGYCAQIPQLCRLAGMTRFFTQKLSWNNINNFPHTTFNWVSPDGSQVLCHMAPAETYTAEAHFGDVKRSVTQHKSMDQDPTSLLVFGKGDGGGGPTWEHLEKLRRCRGLADTVDALPRVKMGDSMDDFYARLEKKAEQGTQFVTWYGELYFELHRGTYTTQARTKRNNRRAEVMLHDIEYLATLASIKDAVRCDRYQARKEHSYTYPKTEIDEMWEAVLLCQFHDCLPGSSIEMCYDDSDELYEKVFDTGHKLLEDALAALDLAPGDASPSAPEDGRSVVVSTLPWLRSCVIPSSESTDGFQSGLTWRRWNGQPEHSASVNQVGTNVFELSNYDFRVQVTSGVITSIYDKHAAREVVPKGAKANQLVLFDDKPLYWQAWDVEVYHLASRQELEPHKVYIGDSGPRRASLVVETRISDASWVKTTISISGETHSRTGDGDTRIPLEFASEIEWHEDKKFLKVEFPVAINPPTQTAAYETQYGLVHRPTHYNTSWDMARFEVCCHRFADLSEAGYGVSVLNDSKYGFATQGNVMRLSLLRAPKAPDAHADMGTHHVHYALLPHKGPLDARTVRAAREFNSPPASPFAPTSSAPRPSLFAPSPGNAISYLRRLPSRSCSTTSTTNNLHLLNSLRMSTDSDPSIILDAIKRGEDDADVAASNTTSPLPARAREGKSIVVRMYDALGGQCRGTLLFGCVPVRYVRRVNLLEDDEELVPLAYGDDETLVPLDFAPPGFEVPRRVQGPQEGAAGRPKGFNVELRAFEVASFRLCL